MKSIFFFVGIDLHLLGYCQNCFCSMFVIFNNRKRMVLEELLKCGDLSVCCGKYFYLRITDKVFHFKNTV